jgi:hypothetical protein
MTQEAPEGGVLETAIQRLDRAIGQLERRLEGLVAEAKGANGELFDLDRAKLAADLDAARARERDLEAAGSQASAALGRAIAEIRAALGEDAGPADQAREA